MHWFLVIVVFIGALIRIAFLNAPMRYDEAYTFLYFAQNSPAYFLLHYPVPNNHIFHTLLVYISCYIFGNEPWIIRLPAFFAGILLIPATYRVAARLFNPSAGLLAAALVAASAPLIEYSVNARGYSLQCLTVLLLINSAIQLRRNGTQLSAFRGYIFWSTIGFYTVPTMLYAFLGIAAWLALSFWRSREDTRQRELLNLAFASLYTLCLTAILYLPILLSVVRNGGTIANQLAPLSTAQFMAQLIAMIQEVGTQWTQSLFWPVIALLILGLVSTTVQRKNMLLFVLVGCVLVVLLFQGVAPFARTWLYLLPITFASSAYGIISGFRLSTRQATSLTFCLVGILLYATVSTQAPVSASDARLGKDAKAIVDYLSTQDGAAYRVAAAIPLDAQIAYYAYASGVTLVPNLQGDIYLASIEHEEPQTLLQSFIAEWRDYSEGEIAGAFGDVWLYHYLFVPRP